ncbi:TM2 domain-containing protein 3 isoform X2 [Pristis pectinata]|uniref:TM2 domain-containing protein 3 isoform X2 n=1 Tax=Pristis pectinata TaxID=685728 RepID=UPI00223CC48B|nr:TM2 domain-containing protein 3 isoform X2 [Pristis pectinata]
MLDLIGSRVGAMASWKVLDRLLVLWPLLGLLEGDSPSTGAPDGLLHPRGTGLPSTGGLGSTRAPPEAAPTTVPAYLAKCPSAGPCSRLPPLCIDCSMHSNCVYGKEVSFNCTVKPGVQCTDENKIEQKTFWITMVCQFCWQMPPSNRTFQKKMYCNWTGGYKWSTALALSITLGGFGADRFYLGQWKEGLGKLFSFGGLGIWTLIDVLLIGIGYVGPADGSLYI